MIRKWMKRFMAGAVVAGMLLANAVPVSAAGFRDVPQKAFYANAVNWAVESGITSGTGPDTFSPNAKCTRGQIITFIWKAAGEPKASAPAGFTDVKPGKYYYDAVNWAVENGITSGTGNNTFSPNASCTRAQVVTFLHKAAGGYEINNNTDRGGYSFWDVSYGDWYKEAVYWAANGNITSGTDENHFSPNRICTRAQAMTFLYNASRLPKIHDVTLTRQANGGYSLGFKVANNMPEEIYFWMTLAAYDEAGNILYEGNPVIENLPLKSEGEFYSWISTQGKIIDHYKVNFSSVELHANGQNTTSEVEVTDFYLTPSEYEYEINANFTLKNPQNELKRLNIGYLYKNADGIIIGGSSASSETLTGNEIRNVQESLWKNDIPDGTKTIELLHDNVPVASVAY